MINNDISPPVILSFAVTRACNLKCKHCYSESVEEPHPDELTTEEAKVVIHDMAKSGARLLIFDGGEPLLRDDLCELIKYAGDVGLRPLLGTNATLIDKKMANNLKDAGLKAVAVSLDGYKAEVHDEFRGIEGTFNNTIAGIKELREVGLPFQIGPCIHSLNFGQLSGIVELARELGANACEVFDYIPSGRGGEDLSLELSTDERRELIREIIHLQRESDDLVFRCIGIPQYWVEVEKTVPEDEVLMKFVRSCCGAGTRYACVMYEGTVYPCMVLHEKAGDVREKPFDEIWYTSEVFNTLRDRDKLEGKCGSCGYRHLCGGSRCKVYEKTGSLTAEDLTCWFNEDELKR
jgi:radical SAM protein with 4Fe4S-binding SPASM domain